MKPRQIKKNSRSAMELLIKVFSFNKSEFYLEVNDKTNLQQWVLMYSESHESSSIYALSNQLLYATCKWEESESPYFDCKQPVGGIDLLNTELIQYCRKLAKAGVKFK